MTFLSALAFAGALIGLSVATANAQTNCSALSGTPMMCLENHSSYPIVGLQATSSASFGSNWIAIPGGMIPPGGMSVVRFPTGWGSDCNKFVVVKTASGAVHTFPGVNVCTSTKFVVAGW